MNTNRQLNGISLLLSVSLLYACGGGGGDEQENEVPLSWSAPVQISASGTDGQSPIIGADGAGNAIAAFKVTSGTLGISSNEFNLSSGWGIPQRRTPSPSTTTVSYDAPDLVVIPDGRALAIVNEVDRFGVNDETWGIEKSSSVFSGSNAFRVAPEMFGARVALNSSGDGIGAVALGLVDGLPENDIFVRNFQNVRRVTLAGTTFTIDGRTTAVRSPPAVAVDENNNAVVAWSQAVGSGTSLFAAVSSDPLSGGFVEELVDVLSPPALNPDVATNFSGDTVLVWDQSTVQTTVPTRIYARNRQLNDVTGSWLTAVRLDVDTTGDASHAKVVVDDSGNAIVVWQQGIAPGSGASRRIWANRYATGVGWGTAERIDDALTTTTDPDLAIGPSGKALVVWVQAEAGASRIYSAFFTPAKGWGVPTRVENEDPLVATEPSVIMNSMGNAFAAWTVSDPAAASASSIQASHYR